MRTINPPLWEMAHVGWFQEFWCLRNRDGGDPPPCRLQNADPILDSAIIPHPERWQLPRLTHEVVQRYLEQVFAGAIAPRYWRKDHGQWLVQRFDQWESLASDDPVMHVNAFEAEAYCRCVGRRLPTETEWEFAARAALANGADRFPWGDVPRQPGTVNLDGVYGRPVAAIALAQSDSRHRLRQMIGNVWEWTASPFEPYPGFTPGPYTGNSQPWFHTHRALRGGCFATRSRLVHNR